jgi:cytochrome c5
VKLDVEIVDGRKLYSTSCPQCEHRLVADAAVLPETADWNRYMEKALEVHLRSHDV